MSTMMQTQNPEAHARLVNPVVLPGVGAMVVYHMRPHEMRGGRTVVPAMVMKVDADNMRLDLLLFYDHMDMMLARDVPPRIGTDRGWEVQAGDTAALQREVEGLRAELAALKDENPLGALDAFKAELATALFGDNEKPDSSLLDMIVALRDAAKSAPVSHVAGPTVADKRAKRAAKRAKSKG